jgi:hypothetical protein
MTAFIDDEQYSEKGQLLLAVDFLELVVNEALQGKHINPALLALLVNAWSEIRSSGGLDQTRQAIEKGRDASLRAHGLSSANLVLKRLALREWYRFYGRRQDGASLKKVVQGLRSLFGSLFDAAGAGPFLKEFLDMLAGSIQADGEELAAE